MVEDEGTVTVVDPQGVCLVDEGFAALDSISFTATSSSDDSITHLGCHDLTTLGLGFRYPTGISSMNHD